MTTPPMPDLPSYLAQCAALEAWGNQGWTRVEELETLAQDLIGHLDYCGWGDSWERQCSEELRKRAEAFLEGLGQKSGSRADP